MASEAGPVYRRIVERLRGAIADGRLAPGARLESERELAQRHRVSLMTARRALVELDRMGLVTRRIGAGTFVAPVRGGARRLRDPHEEYRAPECIVISRDGDWVREWRDGKAVVVEEQVSLTAEGALGTRPLLEFLGEAAIHAAEEVWAEAGHLRLRQTIYGPALEILAVRELSVTGRRMENWVSR